MNIIRLCTTLLAASFLAAGLGACSSSGGTTSSGRPSLNTARVALANGSADLALNICNNLLADRSTEPSLLVCKGDALASMGRNAEAIPAYEQALARDPWFAAARLGLGRVSLTTDPARAEALFLAALATNPRDAAALNNLGIARDLQGHHAAAQAAYGEAIASAPDLRAPQINLGLSLALAGRAAEGVRILRPIATRPEASARERHDFAAVLAMDGKTGEAAKLLRPELDGAQADEAVIGYQALPAH